MNNIRRNRLLVILMFCCTALCFMPVFAGLTDAITQWAANMMNDITKGMLTNDALEVFSAMPANLRTTQSSWNVVSTVNQNIIKPFAFSLVGLCFMIRLAHMVTDFERMFVTPERFLGPVMQMVATMFLVSKSFDITVKLMEIGVQLSTDVHAKVIGMLGQNVQSLFEKLTADVTPSGNALFAIADTIKDMFNGKLWQAVVAALALVLPWLLSMLISLLTKIAAYGVIIELLVRAAFVPLFAGDVMLHGFEGRGFGVIKGFFGACCQGAIFILIAAIVNAMNYDALSPALASFADTGNAAKVFGLMAESAIKACIYMGAGLALMMKSSEIVRSVFGES